MRESGKERIRDLVKNPLRLTLLCFNWYLGEGKLPETKAGLYEQFVADFYDWKKGQFATTGEQRRRLNAALRELAREAIDKEATRFRLRQEFVCEYLGEPDDADSLFGLALQLGWLNKVGVEAENPRKGVYAFFHPTFQEYFAAKDFCDRADWEGLAQHIIKENWQEVFLLSLDMMHNVNDFVLLMLKKLNESLANDAKLQKYLAWVQNKSVSIKVPYKSAAVRAFYFVLNLNIGLALKLDIELDRNLDRARLQAKDIDRVLNFELARVIDKELA
ncbi:NACHT domain-containing protein, partial [Nostoc sp.]